MESLNICSKYLINKHNMANISILSTEYPLEAQYHARKYLVCAYSTYIIEKWQKN